MIINHQRVVYRTGLWFCELLVDSMQIIRMKSLNVLQPDAHQ